MYWLLSVEYNLKQDSSIGIDPELDNTILRISGGEDAGAGSGFGTRDIDLGFSTEEAAILAAQRLKRQLPQLHISDPVREE